MTKYSIKPKRLLKHVLKIDIPFSNNGYCAGFELSAWRCEALAKHLIEWVMDYALKEDELNVNHSNSYVKMQQAAVRVYTSDNYKRRGEVGEILLHAICRDFFETIPIAPRVFYLTSSNEVVKSFDMAHVRYLGHGKFELWLGEAKFYETGSEAVTAAIDSVERHIQQGFLENEKLIMGPQISKDIEHHAEIRELFASETSLDDLMSAAVFPICIACDSKAASRHGKIDDAYLRELEPELKELAEKLEKSGLRQKIRILLIYIPLGSKAALAEAFDRKLKGLSA
ncbi:HamA C-terminal domain-containing protein [Neorhizobium tomejilense]|uniref:HamA C-terminal domain-containing protein n=1 Tax=Neorhizobium tomejilense TaxID=2093828 RepID=UPI003ED158EE